MIELEEITAAFSTDEARTLLADYTRQYLTKHYPEHVDDKEFAAATMLTIMKEISNRTVPEGMDSTEYILTITKGGLDDLIQENATSPTPECIPPRPLPTGSPYLNPEEVDWLLKYDSDVKAAAERYAKDLRNKRPETCNHLRDDEIVEIGLNTLYQLNRRDPEVIAQHNFTPSFLEQFSEGSTEEILIRWFRNTAETLSNSYSASTGTSTHKPSVFLKVLKWWVIICVIVGIIDLIGQLIERIL